jgi:hypothetical protein
MCLQKFKRCLRAALARSRILSMPGLIVGGLLGGKLSFMIYMSAIFTKLQLATLAEILEGIFHLKQTVSYFLLFQLILMYLHV